MLAGPVVASGVAALAVLPLRQHAGAFLVGAVVYAVSLVVFERALFPTTPGPRSRFFGAALGRVQPC